MTAHEKLSVPETNIEAIERELAEEALLEGIGVKYHQLFRDLRDEVVAIRTAATPADITLLLTIVEAVECEQYARELAREARLENRPKDFITYTKLAESQIRVKSAALSRLGLAGDRRGVGDVRKAAFAVNNRGTTTEGKRGGKWDFL